MDNQRDAAEAVKCETETGDVLPLYNQAWRSAPYPNQKKEEAPGFILGCDFDTKNSSGNKTMTVDADYCRNIDTDSARAMDADRVAPSWRKEGDPATKYLKWSF